MGTLTYGTSGVAIYFDDRVLTHLQIVIGAKLRRSEAFFLSWKDEGGVGGGHGSIWVERSIPLAFAFTGAPVGPSNRAWLEQLTVSSNSAQGMVLTEEPVEGLPNPGPAASPARPPKTAPRSAPLGAAAPAAKRTTGGLAKSRP